MSRSDEEERFQEQLIKGAQRANSVKEQLIKGAQRANSFSVRTSDKVDAGASLKMIYREYETKNEYHHGQCLKKKHVFFF